MSRLRPRALASGAVLALILMGCGGGTDNARGPRCH